MSRYFHASRFTNAHRSLCDNASRSKISILGMTNPQYINNVILTGAPPNTSPTQINPGTPGVDFIQPNPTVTIPFPPGISPIVTEVSVPNTNTNVDQIRVVITSPNGTPLVNVTSPSGTNVVNQFPSTPLPENSTLTITLLTPNDNSPQNVTISVIACYTPSTATTVVTSGTVPPSISSTTPSITISSVSPGVTSGTGKFIANI